MTKKKKDSTDYAALYTYRVSWSEDDQEYVGLCAELPSLSHLDSNQAKALSGIMDLAVFAVQDIEEMGEVVPQPISIVNYSGHLTFRTTPENHRLLALKAAESNVSMNRYLNSLL